uniref:Uncharacterized protein n=1 Tax=Rhizophora mucronata TaxID=61149 RepID=A0A2P2PR45_RHIMU
MVISETQLAKLKEAVMKSLRNHKIISYTASFTMVELTWLSCFRTDILCVSLPAYSSKSR